MDKNKVLISYHHSFAGGSKNTSRLIHTLSKKKYDINAITFELPQFFEYTKSKVKFNVIKPDLNLSDVIESGYLQNSKLSNEIINYEEINTYIGVNLYPYGQTLINALLLKKNTVKRNSKIVLHPVGSDIWQIGPHYRKQTKLLLENDIVTSVVTYSKSFADEMKNYYDLSSEINIVPPVLDRKHFYKLDYSSKLQRRKENGFNIEDFIIHHHSSMRPIKCPEVILKIATSFASGCKRKCVLIMMGPIPFEILKEINCKTILSNNNDRFKYVSFGNNITIYWTGILTDVSYFMQISDVELNASMHDSFNISLLEALGCGIPIVSSDVVGIKDFCSIQKANFFSVQQLKYDELQLAIKQSSVLKYFKIDDAIDMLKKIESSNTESLEDSELSNFISQFSPDQIVDSFIKQCL